MRLHRCLLGYAVSSLFFLYCFAQSQPPEKAEKADHVKVAEKGEVAEKVDKAEKADTKAFEAAVSLAQSLTQWAYLIIGGSVLILVGREYHRPSKLGLRTFYLLFIPGWACLALSIYHGVRVQRAYLGYLLRPQPNLAEFKEAMNSDAYAQMSRMHWGLGFLALWLLIYLSWWVFGKTVQASPPR